MSGRKGYAVRNRLQEARMIRFRFFFAAAFLLSCSALLAQTTGNLEGKVTDPSGGALPGVTVEARSPALQGTRSVSTGFDGAYRFALLPPGEYTVTFKLEGFQPRVRPGVTVSLGKEAILDTKILVGIRD